jgi:hypothetical protein
VGHCLELYADFTGTGRAYGHFPDRNGFRLYMEDLRKPETRALLKRIWQEPHSLDPSKEAARVTRDIARRLAQVSKALEERGCNAEEVAHFLMRCLFTMFAEDVELLPPDSFKGLLEKSVKDPAHFPHRLKALWQQMEKGEQFSHIVEARVRHFNGGLFHETTVFDLGREEIGELLAASNYSWTEVDPAIFGTLLEQALDRTERKKLGAHSRPAPMCSGLWKPRSWSPCATTGRMRCAGPSTPRRAATRRRRLPPCAPSTTSSAPPGCSTPPAAPATSSTCPWS